jgi:hypothetical protein
MFNRYRVTDALKPALRRKGRRYSHSERQPGRQSRKVDPALLFPVPEADLHEASGSLFLSLSNWFAWAHVHVMTIAEFPFKLFKRGRRHPAELENC